MARIATLSRRYWMFTGLVLAAALLGRAPALVPPLVVLTLAQSLHFRILDGDWHSPAAQTRIGYAVLLTAGLWPVLAFVHWLQLAGTLSSVTLNYCPMARFVSLLPWNRVERLTLQLAARTLLASPRTWRFPAAGRLRSASEAP
jgi:hypothetical protein